MTNSTALTCTHVFDAESGEAVPVTATDRKAAAALHSQIIESLGVSIIGLREMKEKRRYLALGCPSWAEYCDAFLPFTRQHTYKLLAIAEAFGPRLLTLGLYSESVASCDTSESGDGVSGAQDAIVLSETVNVLGVAKTYELTKLDTELFAQLVSGETITTEAGETVSVELLREATQREAVRLMQELRRPLDARFAAQAAEIETLRAEKEATQEELEDARAIEAEYRPRARLLAQKRQAIRDASDALSRLNTDIIAVGVEPGDPASLQEDLIALLGKLQGVEERCRRHYHDVHAALIGLDD